MKTKLLSDKEFHATMVDPLCEPPATDDSKPVDIWLYIESIPESDFENHSIGDNDVEMVRRTGDGKYDHVLIPTETKNVYLVILVDIGQGQVHGHHLLNLNQKYGIQS